jgi:hypothetical protein
MHSRWIRCAFRTTRRLSKLAAHSIGIPSSGPNLSSVGIMRTVRVIGAASTDLRTGIAASRVMTRNGRRPTSGSSPNQTSPRRGVVTKALQRLLDEVTRRRRLPRPAWVALDCSPRRSTDPSRVVALSARSLPRPLGPPPLDSRKVPLARVRPTSQADPWIAVPRSVRLPCSKHTRMVCMREAPMHMTEVRKRSRNGSGPNVRQPSAPIRSDLSSSARSAAAGYSARPMFRCSHEGFSTNDCHQAATLCNGALSTEAEDFYRVSHLLEPVAPRHARRPRLDLLGLYLH